MQSFDTPTVPPAKQKSKVIKPTKQEQSMSKQGSKRITRSQIVALEDKTMALEEKTVKWTLQMPFQGAA